jgi:hypothetical protein
MTRAGPARRYSVSEMERAAFLAGSGATAEEIAEAIGRGVNAQNIYALLSRRGLRLVPKSRTQTCFPLVISRDAMTAASRHAAARGVDPQWLIGRVVEQCLRDRTLMGEIIARLEVQ